MTYLRDKFPVISDKLGRRRLYDISYQSNHILNVVVHRISGDFSCNLPYIGQTKSYLKVRFDEHCKTEGSNMTEIEKYLTGSPGQKVSLYDVQILCIKQHFSDQKILENILIQQSNLNFHIITNKNFILEQ